MNAGFTSSDSSGTNQIRYLGESGGYEPQLDLARYLAYLGVQHKTQSDDLYGGNQNAANLGYGFFGANFFPKATTGTSGSGTGGQWSTPPPSGDSGGTFGGTLGPTDPGTPPPPGTIPPINPPGSNPGGSAAPWNPETGSSGPPQTEPPKKGKPYNQNLTQDLTPDQLLTLWSTARK